VSAAALVVIVAGLRAAQSLIIPFLVSAFLAILCVRPVNWLQRHRVPTVAAVLLVVVTTVLGFAVAGAIVGGSLNEFVEAAPRYQRKLESLVSASVLWIDQHLEVANLDVPPIDAASSVKILSGGLKGLAGALKGLASAVSNVLFVTLMLIFILLEATGIPIKMQVAFGRRKVDFSRFAKIVDEVQRYLAIKTGLSLVTGVLLGLWTSVLGLDFAVVWGLLVFLLNYVPTIGSIVAALPPTVLCLAQLGPGRALLVLVGFLFVNVVIGNLIEPHLMGRKLGLSTLVVFLSLVFWGWIWGPIGMLLSVPLTMIVKILLENSRDLGWVAVMLDTGKAAAQRLNTMDDDGELESTTSKEDPATDRA